MSKLTGTLQKMRAELHSPIDYFLRIGEEEVHLNPLIGSTIQLEFTGNIHCIQCGRETKKSFQQGYCFPCLRRLQECNLCIIHPERCQVEEGACPTDDWAHNQCHQSHFIYLANSSALKVGITRHTQIPTRWIDQGAAQALPIFRVTNRYRAGLVEVALKQFVSDKTNWRTMLKQMPDALDLVRERDALIETASSPLQKIVDAYSDDEIILLDDESVVELNFPVEHYPTKIVSHSFDKSATVFGSLQGIKGQYLLLDTGVLNVRKFGGYEIVFG